MVLGVSLYAFAVSPVCIVSLFQSNLVVSSVYEKDASAWSYKRVMVERSIEQARAFIDPDRWKAAAKIRTSEQRALLHGKEWNQGKQMDYYSESDGNRAHEEDIAVLNAVFNSHRFPVCDTWIAEGGEALSESGGGDALPLIDDASCGSPVNSSAPPHFIVLGAMKAGEYLHPHLLYLLLLFLISLFLVLSWPLFRHRFLV